MSVLAADIPVVTAQPLFAPAVTGWDAATPEVTSDANPRTPLTVTCQDVAGESYRVSGELLMPSAKTSARLNVVTAMVPDRQGVPKPQVRLAVSLQPADGNAVQIRRGRSTILAELPSPATGTWVPFTILRINNHLLFSVAGKLIDTIDAADDERGISLVLVGGAAARKLTKEPVPAVDPAMVPLSLEELANCELGEVAGGAVASAPAGAVSIGGVPFLFPADGRACDVAPSMSGVEGLIKVKSIYNNPKATGNLGRLVLPIPDGPWSALELVAFSRQLEGSVPRMTVRCGFGGYSGIFADTVVDVPGLTGDAVTPHVVGRLPITLADGTRGELWRLRVSLADTGMFWLAPRLVSQLEFTRDIRVHVNQPDPNEYSEMPIGPASGVVVMAATLVRSPLVVSHEFSEPGNIFHDDQPVTGNLHFTNPGSAAVPTTVSMQIAGPGTAAFPAAGFSVVEPSWSFSVPPGEQFDSDFDITRVVRRRGWYSCTLEVIVKGEVIQRRRTSFAVIAPDTRKATTDSPFGVWCFFAAHNVAGRADLPDYLGSIMKKGGWRWTYGGSPSASRNASAEDVLAFQQKWGVTSTLHSPPQGYQRGAGWFDAAEFEAKVKPDLDKRRELGLDRTYKVLHESRSSTDLIRRYSELMGGEEYDMPEAEKAKLDAQYEKVVAYCRALKAADPDCRIVLINDYPQVGMEYMKRGVPKDVFDIFGTEGANFQREPERQPDWLCLNAIQQNWIRAKAKYGYEDKPVWYTEALYHGTNPGNLTLDQQARIYVREAMLALANGVQRLTAMGCLKNSADDYRWSHWGEVGYLFRLPEANPKPSFAMFAWLTQILDQAKYAGTIDTGTTALYVLDFARADGSQVYPVWVVRGLQTVTFAVTGKPVVYDAYGNQLPAEVTGGRLTINASGEPVYVTNATLSAVVDHQPVEMHRPFGEVVVDFAQPGVVTPDPKPNAVLDAGWDYPRFKGQFAVELEPVDGTPKLALKVAMLPDQDPRLLLQRYVSLDLAKPVQLPGRPESLTVRVKGNGGWGRIMFELTDAKGRVWTSCGNQYSGATNSSDNKGNSYVSFDGWQTLTFDCLGEYASGDQRVAFPYNSNWWPTNHPELEQLKQDFAAAQAAYPGKVAEWEKAVAEHEAAVKAYTAAKAAGDKKAKNPGKPPAKPREPAFRNLGFAQVDYPLTLTKVIVAMSPHIIYVNREVPVESPVIWLDKLGVLEAKP